MEMTASSARTSTHELELVPHFIIQLENVPNHTEVWHKVTALTLLEKQALLEQLPLYFSKLSAIPKSEYKLLMISTLEAVCLAYTEHETLGIQKLQNLMHHFPDSRLVHGAYNFIRNNKKSIDETEHATQPPQLFNESTTKLFSDFITAQQQINKELVNKLDLIAKSISELFIPNQKAIANAIVQSSAIIQNQVRHVEQTLHLVNRRIPHKENRPVRCVFLVNFLQAWNTLADVYDTMKASSDFEPIVISTARKRSKDRQHIFGEEFNHEFLQSEGIPHIRLDTAAENNNCMDILKALEPDLIFRQSPYLDLPPVFNPESINFARLCYVPYSFTAVKRVHHSEPLDAACSTAHTDLPFHRLCWRIFCETEMHKEMYVHSSIRSGENVVVTGYPKFDRLITAKKRVPFWPISALNSGRRRLRVIWAPHHSVSPEVLGFGTFVETHLEMLEWAKQSEQDYEFVLKPHPALVGEVVHNIKAFSQEYMDSYFNAWNALPNTSIFEGGDYGPLFVGSDVMLTDGVGFISEYQLFEKPLIFLESKRHFGFNQAGSIMVESTNRVQTIQEARAICERLKNGESDPMQEKQKHVLSRIMPYPGQSAQKIVQAIREGLVAEGVRL